MLHKADEASIQLLVAFDLVLELTLLVPVQLFFVHRQRQAFDKVFEVLGQREDVDGRAGCRSDEVLWWAVFLRKRLWIRLALRLSSSWNGHAHFYA